MQEYRKAVRRAQVFLVRYCLRIWRSPRPFDVQECHNGWLLDVKIAAVRLSACQRCCNKQQAQVICHAEQQWAESLAAEAYTAWQRNDTRALWRMAKRLGGWRSKSVARILSATGKVVEDVDAVAITWAQYWAKLLKG